MSALRFSISHAITRLRVQAMPTMRASPPIVPPWVSSPLSLQLRRRQFVTVTQSLGSGGSSQSKRPSLFLRIVRGTLVLATGFFLATTPYGQLLAFMLNPPSDTFTLAFDPSTPEAQAIEAQLNALPLVRALRQDPSLIESRPHLKIPEGWRPRNLTAGALAGPGRLEVPPLAFADAANGTRYIQLMHVGPGLCGHPGIIHGGFLATMLDEGLARCCFPRLPGHVGVTARLEVDYVAPTMAGQIVVLRAETVKAEGRKAWVEGRIETVPEREGEEPKVLVRAKGFFVSPRSAKILSKLYTTG